MHNENASKRGTQGFCFSFPFFRRVALSPPVVVIFIGYLMLRSLCVSLTGQGQTPSREPHLQLGARAQPCPGCCSMLGLRSWWRAPRCGGMGRGRLGEGRERLRKGEFGWGRRKGSREGDEGRRVGSGQGEALGCSCLVRTEGASWVAPVSWAETLPLARPQYRHRPHRQRDKAPGRSIKFGVRLPGCKSRACHQ